VIVKGLEIHMGGTGTGTVFHATSGSMRQTALMATVLGKHPQTFCNMSTINFSTIQLFSYSDRRSGTTIYLFESLSVHE
jgi:hypothetical protein